MLTTATGRLVGLELGAVAVIAGVLALISSSVEVHMPFVEACAFWTLQIGLIVVGQSVWVLVFENRWLFRSLKPVAKSAVLAVGGTVLLAVPSLGLDFLFAFSDQRIADPVGFGVLGAEYVDELWMLFVPVAFVTVFVVQRQSTGKNARQSAQPATEERRSAEAALPFWRRMKKHRFARLIAIEAEQHYIMVHTTAGSEMILYKFGDAIRDLDGWGGYQTHRSWWIAPCAPVSATRKGNNLFISLPNGLHLPVSRSRRRCFEDWLDGQLRQNADR